jgi:hypothetical protein
MPHCQEAFAIAIEIGRNRDVIWKPPLLHYRCPGPAQKHEPGSIRGAPNRELGFAVAIEIGHHRDVAGESPMLNDRFARTAAGYDG